jgi:sulfopyruvate decarboxylase subunit alpha
MSSPIRTPQWAQGVCQGLWDAGCRHVTYVPDNPLSHVLREFGEKFPSVTTTLATREEEAFGIAAGLYLGGVKPAVLLQSSGLGNSLNALTSLTIPYRIPALVVISMRGDAGEWNSAQMPMGKAIRAICESMELPHTTVASPEAAAATVRLMGETAFRLKTMGVCLIPRMITAPPAAATGAAR